METTPSTQDPLVQAVAKYTAQVDKLSLEVIPIVGGSGTGKTYSANNLPRDTTAFFNMEEKPLPYREPFTYLFGVPKNSIGLIDTQAHFNDLSIAANSPKIEIIFYDSFSAFSDLSLQIAKRDFKGYDIYNRYSDNIEAWIIKIRKTGKIVIFTARDELLKIPNADGTESAKCRIGVHGKDWERRIVESRFTTVFFTLVGKQPNGNPSFQLLTQTDGVNTAKCPPKYGLSRIIPHNDMGVIISSIKKSLI